ncbi:MAG: LysM peptidoglycan-binding domain-containing protein [Opitutaceae bacterium]|nr:LysM peptidoglycan-binding domain-containing protein [Opitutaceae bacterium]
MGASLLQSQQEIERFKRLQDDATAAAQSSHSLEAQLRSEIESLKAKLAEADKAAEQQNSSVAELTGLNVKLQQDRDDLNRQVEAGQKQLASLQADSVRLTQALQSAEMQRGESERSASQNIAALSAQLVAARRDTEALRAAQVRLTESNAALERERSATMAQLREENRAITVRLQQAQGVLDQIASAARLGTPAATLAANAGGAGRAPKQVVASPAVASTPQAVQTTGPRSHMVEEGDSLSRISLRYYGTANRWQEIYEANRDALSGENALRLGQRLRIP